MQKAAEIIRAIERKKWRREISSIFDMPNFKKIEKTLLILKKYEEIFTENCKICLDGV